MLNRDVAVKEIVWPDQMDSVERDTACRRAVREAQLAARLRHPNVVGIYDIVEEGDGPSIVGIDIAAKERSVGVYRCQ